MSRAATTPWPFGAKLRVTRLTVFKKNNTVDVDIFRNPTGIHLFWKCSSRNKQWSRKATSRHCLQKSGWRVWWKEDPHNPDIRGWDVRTELYSKSLDGRITSLCFSGDGWCILTCPQRYNISKISSWQLNLYNCLTETRNMIGFESKTICKYWRLQ